MSDKGYGQPIFQYISGTTAAVVTTGAVSLVGVVVGNVDSGTVTVGNGSTAINVLTAVGSYDYHGTPLGSGLKITTSTDGDVCAIYHSLAK
jgi:hypothetical protein